MALALVGPGGLVRRLGLWDRFAELNNWVVLDFFQVPSRNMTMLVLTLGPGGSLRWRLDLGEKFADLNNWFLLDFLG